MNQPLSQTQAEKRHWCQHPDCTKSFSTSAHLARHFLVHTGVRKHKCKHPGCQAAFHRADGLTQHQKSHTRIPKGERRGATMMSPQDLLRRQPAPQQLPTMHKFVFASHYDAPSHVVPCQPHVVLIPSFLPSKSNTIAQYASQIPSFPYRRIHHAPISPSQSPIQFVLPSNGHCASVQYIPAAQALQYHLPRVESQVQDLWLRNTQLDSPSRRSSWESVCTVPSTPIPPPAAAAEEGRESNKTAISFLVD